MKKLLCVLVLGFYSTAFADVCQIKPNQNMGQALVNIYALMKGNEQISAATLAPIDFKSLVELRNSLIKHGVCQAETELETCSITLDVNSSNPVVVRIGTTELRRFGSSGGVDTYSLDVAAKTIKMLQHGKVCQ